MKDSQGFKVKHQMMPYLFYIIVQTSMGMNWELDRMQPCYCSDKFDLILCKIIKEGIKNKICILIVLQENTSKAPEKLYSENMLKTILARVFNLALKRASMILNR